VIRYLKTSIFILFISLQLQAQEKAVDQFVKTWKLTDLFGTVDSLTIDTVHHNFQHLNYIDNFSIANSYNGNMG
jgi:hypothetical protein